MNKTNNEKLDKEFDFIRKGGYYGKGLSFGVECEDGWFKLIYNLSKQIRKELNKDKKLKKKFRVVQIKEKWGGLRYYVSCGNNKIFDLIHKAEKKSYTTCETCGKKGKIRSGSSWWVQTLCRKCLALKKTQYKRPFALSTVLFTSPLLIVKDDDNNCLSNYLFVNTHE